MVKVVWGEPTGSPEAGIRFVEPGSVARGRPVYYASLGQIPIRRRRIAPFVVGCILVGLVIGWLLP